MLAAQRGGIKTVIIPFENVKDLADIPDTIKGGLNIVPVRWVEDVLKTALEREPEPRVDPVPVVPAAVTEESARAH